MKKSILIALLAITVATKSYDQQIFIQKGDTVTLDLRDFFGAYTPKPFPDTQQSIYTYNSDSPAGRVASARESISGALNKDSVKCGTSRVYGSKLLAACGASVQIYNIDSAKNFNLTFDSSFDSGVQGITLQDFFYSQDGKFTGAVSVESGKVNFYTQNSGGKVEKIAGGSGLTNRVNIQAFPNGDNWMVLAYEKAVIGTTTTGSNTINAADIASASINSVVLAKENNFVDDAEHILDIQVTSKQVLFVTYTIKGSNTPKAAYCTTKQGGAPQIFALDVCTSITLNPKFVNGRFVVNTFNEAKLMTYQYDTDTMMFTQCQLSAQYQLINCLSNSELVRVPTGQVFDHIQPQPDSNANFVFVNPNAGSMSQLTMVFNLRFKNNALAYDQISDVGAYSVTASANNGWVLRQNTFSSYNIYGPNAYLVLNAVDFPQGFGTVTIENNDGHNPITYRTVSVKVLDKLNSFAGLNDIIRSQYYINGNMKKLPVGRDTFNGNNPQFKVNSNQDGISLIYVNEMQFDQTKLEKTIWFTGLNSGITADEKGNFYKFTCSGHITTFQYDCQKDTDVMATLAAGHQIIYASTTEFEPEDGIVIVSSKDKEVTFYYFGVQYEEVYSKTVTVDEPVGEGDIYFKMTGKLYTFYIFQKSNVLLYSVYNKEIAAMPDSPYGWVNSTHVQGDAPFCPVSAQKCPIQPTTVHILSNCEGDNRLFTFYAGNVTDFQGSHERSLNNIAGGPGPVQVCTFGAESIVFNPASGAIFTVKTHDEFSYIGLSESEAGYQKVTGLFCIRDIQAAVITGTDANGKTLVSVLNGNKFFDARNRWHSTWQIDGTVDRVTHGGPSRIDFILSVKGASSYTFYKVFLSGPSFAYLNINGKDATSDASLSLIIDGQTIDTKPFQITDQQFNGMVTVTNTGTHNSTAGVYDFFDLATISGPIFNIGVDQSDTTTVTPRLLNDGTYSDKVQAAINLHEPDFIRHQGRFGVGFRTFEVSTIVYYYQNYDQYWYMEDVGFLCPALDVAFSNQDFALTAMACNEGGEFHLRWFIKSFTAGSSAGNPYNFIKRDVVASEVRVAAINDSTFLVTAINKKINTAINFILTVSNDGKGNYWVSNIQEINSVSNIDTSSSFGKDNTAVLLYTNPGSTTINANMVFTNGTMTQLTQINLPSGLQIKGIDCRVLGSNPSCIIRNNGDIFGDITFNYNAFTHSLTISSSRAYPLYQDYVPNNWNFNEDFLVMRASGSSGEVMLVYSRALGAENNIWWGLTTSQYYNVKDAKTTRSNPIVFRNAQGRSVIRFSQNQLVDVADAPSMPFKAFKAEESLLILSSNIDENQAKTASFMFNNPTGQSQSVPVSKFFDEHPSPSPSPKPSDDKKNNTWLIWLLGGVCVILAIVIVILLTNKGEGGEFEDEEDRYEKQTGTLTKTEDQNDDHPAVTFEA